MQLPGFMDEPVRVSTDVTWWPSDDEFQVSQRVWIKDYDTQQWRMEAMTVFPQVRRSDVPRQLSDALTSAWQYLSTLVDDHREIGTIPLG